MRHNWRLKDLILVQKIISKTNSSRFVEYNFADNALTTLKYLQHS